MRKARRGGLSSRDAILRLLCGSPLAADPLASRIGISGTAVRKALARLEAEGLVTYERQRRGVGKPIHEYYITLEGQAIVSRAHLPLLRTLLDELEDRMAAGTLDGVFRKVGARLASLYGTATGDLKVRLAAGAALLNRLGGVAAVKGTAAGRAIECECCAIGAVVAEHPRACKAIESMLAAVVATPMRERCDRSGRPRCRFEPVGEGKR